VVVEHSELNRPMTTMKLANHHLDFGMQRGGNGKVVALCM
jgi:hypothetical protein